MNSNFSFCIVHHLWTLPFFRNWKFYQKPSYLTLIKSHFTVRSNGVYSKTSVRSKVMMGFFRGPLSYHKKVVFKIIHRLPSKKMANSVKNEVFHQILVYFSKYIIKLFQISTNFVVIINFKKLLINMKFQLWAICSIKD
jgi:hypothetical protein